MAPIDDLLQAGEAALAAGQPEQARALFASAVRADPRSAHAWWSLGRCLPDPQQQADCFRRVLALDPDHLQARQRLQALAAGPVTAGSAVTGAPTPPVPVAARAEVQPVVPAPPAVAVLPATPPPPSTPQRKSNRLGLALSGLGVLLCLVVVGVFAAWRLTTVPAAVPSSPTLSPESNPATPDGALAYPTFPPTWTPSPLPPPTGTRPPPTETLPPPTPTVRPTVDLSAPYDIRLEAAGPEIAKGRRLNSADQWAEALPVWDSVIAQVPEFAEAYYERTRCYLHLNTQVRFLDLYTQNVELALADMNVALELDPTNGDFYYERFAVDINMAGITTTRADYDFWRERSLEDVNLAIQYQTGRTYIERELGYTLVDLRRYAEALAQFNAIPVAEGLTRETDAGLQTGLAESYLGLKQYDTALDHIDLSIAASPGHFNRFDRALILYALGRLDEARAQLDETLALSPVGFGPRYYLRALIHYELGDTDLAIDDLEVGSGQTWERGGVHSYVLGLLALEAGDRAQALELWREAEASLHPRYSTVLLEKIRADLARLSAP